MALQRKKFIFLFYYFLFSLFVIIFISIPVKASFLPSIEDSIHALTNLEREKAGLSPLLKESGLVKMARQHSEEMATHDYFSHTSPVKEYETLRDRADKSGVTDWKRLGENIGYLKGYPEDGTPKKIVEAWIESEGHRDNILDESFTHLGVGVFELKGKYYFTQNFGAFHSNPSTSSVAPNPSAGSAANSFPYRVSYSIGYPFSHIMPYGSTNIGTDFPYNGYSFNGSSLFGGFSPGYGSYYGTDLPYIRYSYGGNALFGASNPYDGSFIGTRFPFNGFSYNRSSLFGGSVPYYGSFVGTNLPYIGLSYGGSSLFGISLPYIRTYVR